MRRNFSDIIILDVSKSDTVRCVKIYWLLTELNTDDIQCYTPDGGPEEGWRPTISRVIRHGTPFFTGYYLLKGTQLNGLSQANIYGDDCYPPTNYPLVRLQNTRTNKVYFARTYHFSTMGVATGASLQSARYCSICRKLLD